jgi:hypothetical protein
LRDAGVYRTLGSPAGAGIDKKKTRPQNQETKAEERIIKCSVPLIRGVYRTAGGAASTGHKEPKNRAKNEKEIIKVSVPLTP